MKKFGLAACLLAILAAPAFAQPADPARVAQFLNLISLNGCSITEDAAERVFPQNGFDRDQARVIVTQLVSAGTLVFANGILEFADGNCSAPMPLDSNGLTAQQAQFIDIMALDNCSMTQDTAQTLFPENGMSFSTADEVADQLMDLGVATIAEDGETLVVGPEYCSPAEIGANTEIAPQNAPEEHEQERSVVDDMNLMLEIMGTVGCRLDSNSSDAVFTAGGLDPEIGVARAFELINQGFAEIIDGTVLVIAEPPCVSTVSDESEAPENTEPLTNDTATDGDESPSDIFHSVMASASCELTELDARNLFPAAGLLMEDAYSIADQLVAAGQAYYSEDDTTLTVTSAECIDRMQAANPVEAAESDPVEGVETMPATDDPEAQFLALLAANACEITQANARDMIAAAGMDYNTTMGIAAAMLNDGRASSPDGGQTLQVSAPLCVAAGSAGPKGPRDIFIEILRGNNCAMTAGEFSSLLPVDGLDQNTAFGLITELEAEGVISLPPTRDVVTLTAGNCR